MVPKRGATTDLKVCYIPISTVLNGIKEHLGSSSASSITQEFGWVTAKKKKVEPMVKNKMGVQIAKTHSGAK